MRTDKQLRLVEQLTENTRRGKIEWRFLADATGRVFVTSLPTGQVFQLGVEGGPGEPRIWLQVRDRRDNVVAEIEQFDPCGWLEIEVGSAPIDPALQRLLDTVEQATEHPLDEALKALEELAGS